MLHLFLEATLNLLLLLSYTMQLEVRQCACVKTCMPRHMHLSKVHVHDAGFGHDIHTKLTKLIQGILQESLGVNPGRCHCVVS